MKFNVRIEGSTILFFISNWTDVTGEVRKHELKKQLVILRIYPQYSGHM